MTRLVDPEKEENAAEGENLTKEPEDEVTPSPATEGQEGQEGSETPPPEPAPEVKPPVEPEALTPEKARALAMDPAMREVLNEDMFRIIQALEGKRAATEHQVKVNKLVEENNLEGLGQLYLDIEERRKQAVEAQQAVDGIRQEFYSTTFASLVKDMPELTELDAEGRKTLDPAKFDSDAAYLKAIVDYVANMRIEAAVPVRAKKYLEDFAAATEAQRAGSANQQAANQPLLPGASPGASLPGGSSDLLDKAYGPEGAEQEE